jgi:nucleoside-diphosphate-sugar epimerase
MPDVLVTGGTGFIGSSLVARLVAKGHDVRVLVRENSPNMSRIANIGVEIANGDITQPASLRDAVRGVKRVFHCAAIVSDWAPRESYRRVNVDGTENILNACVKEGIERFIGLGTNDVFGLVEGKIIDETCPFQSWNEPYPDSKILAERLVWKYHANEGLPATTVYPCWVYGINDTTFLPHIVEALRSKTMVTWRNDALMWPTYIENLLDLLLLVAEHPRAIGQGYLVHDGVSILFEEFCRIIAQRMHFATPRVRIPLTVAHGAGFTMECIWRAFRIEHRPLLTTYIVKNLGSRLQFSIEKAAKELGYAPRIRFDDALETTLRWFEETGAE